jgi:hypothetical protein
MAINPSQEPIPQGPLVDQQTGTLTAWWRNFFEGRGRQNGEIISGVNANTQTLVDLSTEVGDNAAAILSEAGVRADADTAIAGTVTSLTATVGTNTSNISANDTARADGDTANATSITTLEAYVSNPRPNLLPNSGFELGTEGWTVNVGSIVNNTLGVYLTGTSTGGTVVTGFTGYFPANEARVYSLSLDSAHTLASGSFRADIEWFNGASFISRSGQVSMAASSTFNRSELINQTAPTNTTQGRVRFFFVSSTSGDIYRLQRFKVEDGATATNYTAEGASVGVGSKVTQIAEAYATGTSSTARLVWTVNTSTNAATIEQTAATGYTDGTWNGAAVIVTSDVFKIIDASSGERFEFSDGNIRIYDSSDVLRVQIGVF